MRLSIALTLTVGLVKATAFEAAGGQKPLKPKHPPTLDIPSVGLGLWNSKDDDATKAVKYAFKAGYNHFDSAAAYSNEDHVGAGLHAKRSPKDRSEYWITSKLWNTAHQPKLVGAAFNKTVQDLGVKYLDLYLMHWPVAFKPNTQGRTILDQDVSITDTWKAMEDLVRSYNTTGFGARHIGISNFSPRQIDQILDMCTICPYAHEFEIHPYLQQQEFVDYHHKTGIKVIAYSPLANINPTYKDKYPDLPPILEDKFWVRMAETKNISVAQAILGWGVARGTVVIPKSIHENRIIENLASKNVTFSPEEMAAVREQDRHSRFNNPSKGWGVDLFEGLDDGSNRFMVDL